MEYSNVLFSILQGTNGEIEYFYNLEITLPKKAFTYFYINKNTGEISVIKNLRADAFVNTYKVSKLSCT